MRPGRCPLIVLAATVAAVMAESRLVAILSLGVVGVVIALIFLLYGAPDVAITQFMVETLVVIIVALVLARLPRLTAFARPNRRSAVRDGVIAVAFGAVVTAVMLAVIDLPTPAVPERVFRRAELHRRLRPECGQRDPGRFPGDGHAGGNPCRGDRRSWGLRAAEG